MAHLCRISDPVITVCVGVNCASSFKFALRKYRINNQPPATEPEPQVDIKAIQNEYVAAFKSAIYGCKFYPEQAERMEREGSVKVRFTVTSGGGVSGVNVASSSGFNDLDNAAVQAVKNATPFAAIPEELGKSSLTIASH